MVSKKKVIVVGGGLAGLAAAHRLQKNPDFQVEVYEKREILGGKWSAWKDKEGDWIETGLHVFFGAYQEIYDLMKEVGIYQNIDWKEHVLTYTLKNAESFEFRTLNLPSPFHLLPAVLQNTYFSLKEKLSLSKALFYILFGSKKYYQEQDQLTYQEWHRKQGIADKMLKRMFLPMTLALKFLPPEKISAKIVLDVTGTFLRENKASEIGFLKGSPETHLTQPIAQEIQAKGGQILSNFKLKEIKVSQEKIEALKFIDLSNNQEVEKKADYYLFALPIHNLKKLIPSQWSKQTYFNKLSQIESVPVVTLHLWLDRKICDYNNILFSPDGYIPVYADMNNTTEEYQTKSNSSRFQFVVAPAFDLIKLSDEEITDLIWQNVQEHYPETSKDAKITKAVVVKVPQSVYFPNKQTDHLRVSQESPIYNWVTAGGYTIQDFYDSMEGAVRSGNRAAEVILAKN